MMSFSNWLLVALAANGAMANIMFPEPYITCKTSVDECLRGEVCIDQL